MVQRGDGKEPHYALIGGCVDSVPPDRVQRALDRFQVIEVIIQMLEGISSAPGGIEMIVVGRVLLIDGDAVGMEEPDPKPDVDAKDEHQGEHKCAFRGFVPVVMPIDP